MKKTAPSKQPKSQEFLLLGDEWLVAYSQMSSIAVVPLLFIVGHCLECYLKAALLKHDPGLNIYEAKYGHNIKSMISEICKNVGQLSLVEIRETVVARFMTGGPVPMHFVTDPDYLHYTENQELYWVANFQQDIKYLGTTGKKMSDQFAVLIMARNPFWVKTLKPLRDYISTEWDGLTPPIYKALEDRSMSQEVRNYIREIVT